MPVYDVAIVGGGNLGLWTAYRLARRGVGLRYLPPYSPDLSPIEPCWSKLKTGLRTAKARTRAVPETAITQALTTITAVDARGWFHHCGYTLQ